MELKAAARTWPIVVCLVILTSIPTMAIRCYVCGPASLDVFPSSSPSTVGTLDHVRPCEEFDSALNKTDFEKDCPENFLGCITQTEENGVSRSCESLKMQGCHNLLNSAYCLCDSDLCNHAPITMPTPIPASESPREESGQFTDDEDYVDKEVGSGDGSDLREGSVEEVISSDPGSPIISTSSEASVKEDMDQPRDGDFFLDKPSSSESYYGPRITFGVLCLPLILLSC